MDSIKTMKEKLNRYKGKFLGVDPMSNYSFYDGITITSGAVDKKRPFLSFDFAVLNVLGIGKRKNEYRAIIMEVTHFPYMASNKILYGQRAILRKYAEFLKIDFFEYSPAEIKKSFCGNGRADKEDMISKCKELDISVKNHDEADSVGIYFHHLSQLKIGI